MIWVYTYLTVGVLITLVMCFIQPARTVPVYAFVLTVAIVILVWPLTLIAGYLSKQR